MTRHEYSLGDLAVDDLSSIWLRFAEFDIDNADRFISELVDTFQMLADNRLAGRERTDIRDDLRYFPKDDYCIFYHPTPSGIRVSRIVHSARDIQKIIDEGGFS